MNGFYTHLLPPATKFRKFTPVCDCVHRKEGGSLSRGSLCPGGSLSGGLCPGAFLSGGSLSRGSPSRGSLSRGSLSGGSMSRGITVRETYVSYWNAFLLRLH